MKTVRKILNAILLLYSIILTSVLMLGATSFGISSGNLLLPILSIPIALYFIFIVLKIKKGRKILFFYSLLIVSLMTIAGFKTATSTSQLISSLLFLPMTFYFWLKILPKGKRKKKEEYKLLEIIPETEIKNEKPTKLKKVKEKEYPEGEFGKNFDINRRLFLKLIGSAGISVFMLALFTKKAQASFFGSVPGPGTVSLKDTTGAQIDPAIKQPTDGYSISQIDDSIPSYYGFVDKSGNWYIMKEDSSSNYRYSKGASSFSTNWTNRATLTYDYFDTVF